MNAVHWKPIQLLHAETLHLCSLVRRMSFDQFVGRPLRPDMPRKLQKALYNIRVSAEIATEESTKAAKTNIAIYFACLLVSSRAHTCRSKIVEDVQISELVTELLQTG